MSCFLNSKFFNESVGIAFGQKILGMGYGFIGDFLDVGLVSIEISAIVYPAYKKQLFQLQAGRVCYEMRYTSNQVKVSY